MSNSSTRLFLARKNLLKNTYGRILLRSCISYGVIVNYCYRLFCHVIRLCKGPRAAGWSGDQRSHAGLRRFWWLQANPGGRRHDIVLERRRYAVLVDLHGRCSQVLPALQPREQLHRGDGTVVHWFVQRYILLRVVTADCFLIGGLFARCTSVMLEKEENKTKCDSKYNN